MRHHVKLRRPDNYVFATEEALFYLCEKELEREGQENKKNCKVSELSDFKQEKKRIWREIVIEHDIGKGFAMLE